MLARLNHIIAASGNPHRESEAKGVGIIDTYVRLIDYYSKDKKVKVVFIRNTAGGSASPEITHLVDLTNSKPKVIELDGFYNEDNKEYKLSGFSGGVTWGEVMWGEKGDYGEYIRHVYRYAFGTDKPELLRSLPIYDLSPLDGKKLSEGVLSDPVVRAPLLNILKPEEFKKFHEYFGTSQYVKIIAGRYIVGEGCVPHSCGGNNVGIFIIDQATKSAWALYYDGLGRVLPLHPPGDGEFFGSLGPSDVIPNT